MGRSRPTTREYIDKRRDDLDIFRRSIRREHQQGFDDAWLHVRQYAPAVDNAEKGHDTDWMLLLALCVGQQKELNELREAVEDTAGD